MLDSIIPRTDPKTSYLVSVEQGYALARMQRPGRRILMGPEAAMDAPIEELSRDAIRSLPGPSSWLERDYVATYGKSISLFSLFFGNLLAEARNEKLTIAHIRAFDERSITLSQAKSKIIEARQAAA